MHMSFEQPRQGEPLRLSIRKPRGLRFIGQTHDTTDHHCVLAFFETAEEEPDEDLLLEFPITETGTGTLHSVTALAMIGHELAGHDRIRIRSGITIPE